MSTLSKTTLYTVRISLIVALGGFLMGFDASVISGVIKFIEPEFDLSKLQIGWAVSSLTLTSTLAMLTAGPISDRIGRKAVLRWAGFLYALSAILSAVAPSFTFLVIARMIGGFGVGASLIIAPMYIAEISPPAMRGRMVSFNQLNIVLGISVAFFTNYLILRLGKSDAAWAQSLQFDAYNWRWMLGIEALPAIAYFLALFMVPRSPRWLAMKGKYDDALAIMRQTVGEGAAEQLKAVQQSLQASAKEKVKHLTVLFSRPVRLVLLIGIVVAAIQQLTGINAVFFYAPTIFEQTGIGTDASFIQAIIVGLTNLAFTIVAIVFIDKLGRKFLLASGLAGIVLAMGILAYGFSSATYTLSKDTLQDLPHEITPAMIAPMTGVTYTSDLSFKAALKESLGEELATQHETTLTTLGITINANLVLFAIIFFVASFAVSIGPVMWVLFSELFPNSIRGVAISFVGFINSMCSFLVQLIFPWELAHIGNSTTFLIFGAFAAIGLVFTLLVIPETKGKSLEELEAKLIK